MNAERKVTRRQLIKIFGTSRAIARILGISPQAVYDWELDRPIPSMRLLQLQTLFPDQFGQPRTVEKGGFEIRYTAIGKSEARP